MPIESDPSVPLLSPGEPYPPITGMRSLEPTGNAAFSKPHPHYIGGASSRTPLSGVWLRERTYLSPGAMADHLVTGSRELPVKLTLHHEHQVVAVEGTFGVVLIPLTNIKSMVPLAWGD